MMIFFRAEHSKKASYDIATREVGRNTLLRARLPTVYRTDESEIKTKYCILIMLAVM